jgi:hypothetical protein
LRAAVIGAIAALTPAGSAATAGGTSTCRPVPMGAFARRTLPVGGIAIRAGTVGTITVSACAIVVRRTILRSISLVTTPVVRGTITIGA